MGHHPLSPKQALYHSHLQSLLLKVSPKKNLNKSLTLTGLRRYNKRLFLLEFSFRCLGLDYTVLWATITQNTLTISHCDPIWTTMTLNLVNRFILTQNKVVWLFIFPCLISKTLFFGQIWSQNFKEFCFESNSVYGYIQGCWFWIWQLFPYRSNLGSEKISDNWKPFKNYVKCFFCMLKTLIVFKIVTFLSWRFGHVGKRLDKFGQQIITIQILTNISRRKENQAMKFGQLIEYVRNIFFNNHAENEAGRLIPGLFLFFKKALYKVKAGGQHFSFNIFR